LASATSVASRRQTSAVARIVDLKRAFLGASRAVLDDLKRAFDPPVARFRGLKMM